MKQKIRFGIEVLLVIAAIAVAIYNFGLERQIAYLASIVAVCGTVAILVKDIYKAKKKAFEDARFVLPNACETKIVVTMNARSLMNFFGLRCCNRAQWEIKAVADEMLRLCSQVAPTLFKNAGPSCVRNGKCGEGKMTCGKFKEVVESYKLLKAGE